MNSFALRLIILTMGLSCYLVGLTSAAVFNVAQGESIGQALEQAMPGDEVVVECGTYLEQGLRMPSGVVLRSEYDTGSCVTILTDGRESALICEDLGSDTIIEGVFFKADTIGTSEIEYVYRGGGASCREASPQFINCRFESLVAQYGAAVYCREQSSPSFSNCRFFDNFAITIGGMLACVDHCQPSFNLCLSARNDSQSGAGRVLNAADHSQIQIQSCTFSTVESPDGPDFSSWDFSSTEIDNSVLDFTTENLEPWRGDASSISQVNCSDLFHPTGVDVFPVQNTSHGNINADPMFCGLETGDEYFFLQAGSPCSAEANPTCDLMGALPVGCSLVSVDDQFPNDAELPVLTRLRGNFPNPFNPRTTIRFDLRKAGHVNLAVYDLSGRLVTTLVSEHHQPGNHTASWSGKDNYGLSVAAGAYFLRLQADNKIDTRRVMLIK